MTKKTKIYIASDHAGYKLKSIIIKEYFKDKLKFEIFDLGTDSEKSVDYPIYAKKLCKKIKKNNYGILICGSGVGVSIAANRFTHIRASLCNNEYDTKYASSQGFRYPTSITYWRNSSCISRPLETKEVSSLCIPFATNSIG